jgi:osmoprotectant transport system permease protein
MPATAPALGGTRILYSALRAGEIDIYPEYTGTLTGEILADRDIQGPDELAAVLAEDGLRLSAPLGFQNTYALAVPRRTWPSGWD